MKYQVYLVGLLLFTSFLASCQSGIEFKQELEKSEQVWQEFKKSSGNFYKYTASNSSWVGIAWETIITVKDGKVIQRDFRYTSTGDMVEEVLGEKAEWTEKGDEVGKHQDGAALPLTLEEVYHKARNSWLLKSDKSKRYFEAKNQGLISLCGFVPNDCADDCFTGIRIINIEAL